MSHNTESSDYSEEPIDKNLYRSYMTEADNESLSSLGLTDDNYSTSFQSESSSSYTQLEKLNSDALNKTFSDNRLRDIERENSMLMSKILSKSKRPKQYKTYQQFKIKSSFEINRRKAQAKIEYENKILLKKIHSAKSAVKY